MKAPYYQNASVTIYHGRCEDYFPDLPQVDAVITDPPYGEFMQNKGRRGDDLPDGGKRTKEYGFAAMSDALRILVAREAARLARRWSLVFSDVESCHMWKEDLERAGLDYVRTGIWVKPGATPQFTGDRPASGFECITMAHPKGKKRWNGGGRAGVWTYPIVSSNAKEGRLHTTPKPLALMTDLVALFTDPDEVVLDPFMGSGTTLIAARDTGRKAIGIELDEKYCEATAFRFESRPILDIWE